MKTIRNCLTHALAAIVLTATAAHAAPSIVGDSFSLGVGYQDPNGGADIAVGPFIGTASGAPGAVFSAAEADAVGTFVEGFSALNAHALWIDDDSVHVYFQGDATDFFNLKFTLSGLDFMSAGQPAEIVGASFDRNGGGSGAFSGFNEVILGIVSDPTISFTSSSVTMTFAYFSANLTADGPIMQIDVLAQVVPEPGTYALLLAGLGGMAFCARRRRAG